MPLIKRGVEPVHLSRGIVSSLRNYAETQHITISNELECVTNNTLAQVIRQLSSLSKNAEDIFGELVREAGTILDRASVLQNRIEKLNNQVTRLDSNVEPVSLQDINTKKAFKSRVQEEQQLFSKQTMPDLLLTQYTNHVDPPPPLDVLTPYRTDGKSASKIYSDPGFFFERWTKQMEEEIMRPKKNRDGGRRADGNRGPKASKRPRPIQQKVFNPYGAEYEDERTVSRPIPIAQDHISSETPSGVGGGDHKHRQAPLNHPQQQQQQQQQQRYSTVSNRSTSSLSSGQPQSHDAHINRNSHAQTPQGPRGGALQARPLGPAPPPPDEYHHVQGEGIAGGHRTPPPNYTAVATDGELSPRNDYDSYSSSPSQQSDISIPPPYHSPPDGSPPRNSFIPTQSSPMPKRAPPCIPPPPPPPPAPPAPPVVGAIPPVENGQVCEGDNADHSTPGSQTNSPIKTGDNRGGRSDLLQAIRDGKCLKKVDPVQKTVEAKKDVASILKQLEKIRVQINASDSESDDSDESAWFD